MDFLDWIFSLSIIPLRSVPVVMCLFFFLLPFLFLLFLLLKIFHGMDVLYHFCFVLKPVIEGRLGWFTLEVCKAATID